MSLSPADEYQSRLAARRDAVAVFDRQDRQISAFRLATFAAAAFLAALAWRGTVPAVLLLVPLAVFIVLVKRHERVIKGRERAQLAVDFYERGLARIGDRWAGTGATGERFRDEGHLYANDLDLFGRASLFELLSVARTQRGEEMLADWLKAPAAADVVHARQEAVRELAAALDLREALAGAGAGIQAAVHPAQLVVWAERPSPLGPPVMRWIYRVLTLAAVVTGTVAVLTAAGVIVGSYWPLVAVFLAQGVATARQRHAHEEVLHSTSGFVRELMILRDALMTLERQRFASVLLTALHGRIDAPGADAARAISRLERLVEMHDWEHNMMFKVPATLLMWSSHLAWAIEDWRRQHGPDIRRWLDTVGEFEALSSLATFSYEHPADPFPVIAETGPVPCYEGTGLGHPLIPQARMIRNDVRLGGTTRLIVISGSNMSGKSTVMRTIGVNAVLAFAGGPVRAEQLTLSLFTIGATLRIQDSLVEGRSRFYAEITRIRAIVDAARATPLLFLLDEIFHGTNSHDRLIGASGVLRSLLALGAIGLITTHDLALTAVVNEIGEGAHNVHFEDRLEQGEMYFDYRMKPGPVRRSNALALMRAVGLEVDEETQVGPRDS